MEAIEDLDLSGAVAAELTDADLDILADLDLGDTGSTPPAITAGTSSFDYSGFSAAVAKAAEDEAERIQNQMRDSIIEIGQALMTVKAMLPGKFGEWIKHHFGMSQSTAENYMNAARHFASTPRVVEALPQRLIYDLAAKGTPDDFRKAIKTEIAAGKVPDRDDLEKRLTAAKNAEKAKREEERQKAAAERQRKQEEREWHKREKELRGAGKTDAEIGVERTRWETAKAKKERDKAKRREARAEREREENEQREIRAEERKRQKEVAHEAVAFLQKRLGADFRRFQELMKDADRFEFSGAIIDAKPIDAKPMLAIVAPVA